MAVDKSGEGIFLINDFVLRGPGSLREPPPVSHCAIRKKSEKATGSKSVSNVCSWPLLLSLPLGSCSEFLEISLDDGL